MTVFEDNFCCIPLSLIYFAWHADDCLWCTFLWRSPVTVLAGEFLYYTFWRGLNVCTCGCLFYGAPFAEDLEVCTWRGLFVAVYPFTESLHMCVCGGLLWCTLSQKSQTMLLAGYFMKCTFVQVSKAFSCTWLFVVYLFAEVSNDGICTGLTIWRGFRHGSTCEWLLCVM